MDQKFPENEELLRNMMGLMGNVAEVENLRPNLMQAQYVTTFRCVQYRKHSLFIAKYVYSCKMLQSTNAVAEISRYQCCSSTTS